MTESGKVSEALASLERDLAALWAPEPGQAPKTRACTANLVLVTTAARRDEAIELGSSLATADLARTFVIGLDPKLAPWAVDASVSAHCQKGEGGELLCAERIDLTLGAMTFARAPSLLSALAMAEVPTVLLLTAPAPMKLVSTLAREAARVVVDGDAVGLGAVAALANGTRAHLVDLAWTRLHPWRNALARFFDDPALRPAVTAIRRLKIVTALTEGGAMPEVAQYLVGWLAGRLGWRFVSGQTAIDPFHRAIDLEVEWRAAPLPPGALLAVELDSHLGDTPVTMSVEREGDPPFLCARHDAQERGQGERVTPLASLPLVGLLDRAIADPTSDAVLRATIERAIGYPPGAPPPAVREGGAT